MCDCLGAFLHMTRQQNHLQFFPGGVLVHAGDATAVLFKEQVGTELYTPLWFEREADVDLCLEGDRALWRFHYRRQPTHAHSPDSVPAYHGHARRQDDQLTLPPPPRRSRPDRPPTHIADDHDDDDAPVLTQLEGSAWSTREASTTLSPSTLSLTHRASQEYCLECLLDALDVQGASVAIFTGSDELVPEASGFFPRRWFVASPRSSVGSPTLPKHEPLCSY
jgi:hypothetical protein